MTENKNGLIMESCLTEAGRKAEWEAALAMMSAIAPGSKGDPVGGRQKVTRIKHVLRDCGLWAWWPLVAEYTSSKNWLNDKEREHPQFALSQKKRRLIEKVFSWIKMVAGPAQDQVARASPSRVGFPSRCRSLQLGPHDQADCCDVVPRQQCP